MNTLKKAAEAAKDGLIFLASIPFALVSSVVIHLSGADKADQGPTPQEIEESQRFAEQLKQKYAQQKGNGNS